MTTKETILKVVHQKDSIKTSDVVKQTGISRQAAYKSLQKLVAENRLKKMGTTKNSYYVLVNSQILEKKLKNKNLQEHQVFVDLRKDNTFFDDLDDNLMSILDYAFSEMLNNAIDHSYSQDIFIRWWKDSNKIGFNINDNGIGVFRSIQKKKKLKDEFEAIQELMKGKTTTMPKAHSGEGIFFTSRISDKFSLNSFGKLLEKNNMIDDIFLKDVENQVGTSVNFEINIESKKHLSELFNQYSKKDYAFDTTEIQVKLYQFGTVHISRSQAKRILHNLEKFDYIIFDFKDVPTVGQAFADQIFRVWQSNNPNKKLEYVNANQNVEFMIKRAIETKQ